MNSVIHMDGLSYINILISSKSPSSGLIVINKNHVAAGTVLILITGSASPASPGADPVFFKVFPEQHSFGNNLIPFSPVHEKGCHRPYNRNKYKYSQNPQNQIHNYLSGIRRFYIDLFRYLFQYFSDVF